MKTIKIFLSIAGIGLTGLCFGQLLSQDNSDVLFYTAYYNTESNKLEHQITRFPAGTIAGDYFEAPVSTRTYFVPIEFDMAIEPWMTKPFESSNYEEELQIESWMESPFESTYYEEGPEVEVWMTKPFRISQEINVEIDEELEIETWMTTPWI